MKRLITAISFAILAFGTSVLPLSGRLFRTNGVPTNYNKSRTTTIFHTATNRVTVSTSYISVSGSVLYTSTQNMSLSEFQQQKQAV